MENELLHLFDMIKTPENDEIAKKLEHIKTEIPFLIKCINGANMHDYFGNILNDSDLKNKQISDKMNSITNYEMEAVLSNVDYDNEVILVNTENGNERKFVHQWSNENNLQSVSIMSDFFEENYIYKCKTCKNKIYFNETSVISDYSSITGNYLESLISCPKCKFNDVYNHPYDREDHEWSGLTRELAFNCVVVGKEPPKLSKWCCRKRQNKNKDMSVANRIDLKETKIMTKEHFLQQINSYVKKRRDTHTKNKCDRKNKCD